MIITHKACEILYEKGHFMKKFMENPLGYLVGAIAVVAVISAYLQQIIITAVVIAGLAVTLRFAFGRGRRGRQDHGPAVCMTCGHPAHQHRWCTKAICRCSA